MKTGKTAEIVEEFRTVFAGRGSLVDSILPPIIFLIVNATLGFQVAMWGSLVLAGLITLLRLARRHSLRYAFGGFGGVVVAILVAQWLGRDEGYFLPTLFSGLVTVILCLISVIAGRPLVAWTSFVARRWPLDWYWHPRVRPAYSEVTWLWTFFFAVRLLLQINLFQDAATGILAVFSVLTGWPATVVLLVVSYLYGTWRLQNLRGPSVQEFRADAEPPWTGQQRGF